jgi:hypothetical protein
VARSSSLILYDAIFADIHVKTFSFPSSKDSFVVCIWKKRVFFSCLLMIIEGVKRRRRNDAEGGKNSDVD